MTTETPDRASLIAPGGIDCAVCCAYLANRHQLPKMRGALSRCNGCRARPKHCAYLKAHCVPLAQGQVSYCFECSDYPCDRLRKFDARYRRTYGVSPLDDLEIIAAPGADTLIAEPQLHFACPQCGDLRCMHNRKCYACATVRHWRDG